VNPADATAHRRLQDQVQGGGARARWPLWSVIALLVLVTATALSLVLYLRAFEAQETQRRRSADALWLEQGVQFHFRRLELDLNTQARRSLANAVPVTPPKASSEINVGTSRDEDASVPTPAAQGGQLWSASGVVLAHGWSGDSDAHLIADDTPRVDRALALDRQAHADNAAALDTLRRITLGLQRASYAGPMLDSQGHHTDVVWLSMPVFERGNLVGSYLARLSMRTAIREMVPSWFRDQHQLSLVDAQRPSGKPAATPRGNDGYYLAYMELPGTDMGIGVQPIETAPFWSVPRLLLLTALLFLAGTVVSLSVLRRDIQKRLGVEASLKAQVALRTAMENSVTIGLRAWDLDGRILYVNQAFCRIVGFSEDELVGRHAPLPYWPSDQLDELRLLHQGVISQGTAQSGMEIQFQHKDGQLIDVLIHEAPLNDASGQQFGWMSSVLDISARKRADRMAARQQEKLEASGRLVAMGEVASTLAHELNQPLGALSGFATGLLNRIQSGRIAMNELTPIIDRMERLADKAGRIIQRVNGFARRREMVRQRVELVGFVSRLVTGLQRTEGVHLDTRWPSAPLWIDADEHLLEHAVLNVLNNAQQWALRGMSPARVRIELQRDGAWSGITIADSGPGIGEDNADNIFNAFFSASDGGMGMGLAICRSVLEAHGGHVEVGRDGALGGAVFTLWLPTPSPQSGSLSAANKTAPPQP
jgi:two-component system, LuxR family, sensor histidine kinase DctS